MARRKAEMLRLKEELEREALIGMIGIRKPVTSNMPVPTSPILPRWFYNQ
jgi:hypothetical protein